MTTRSTTPGIKRDDDTPPGLSDEEARLWQNRTEFEETILRSLSAARGARDEALDRLVEVTKGYEQKVQDLARETLRTSALIAGGDAMAAEMRADAHAGTGFHAETNGHKRCRHCVALARWEAARGEKR